MDISVDFEIKEKPQQEEAQEYTVQDENCGVHYTSKDFVTCLEIAKRLSWRSTIRNKKGVLCAYKHRALFEDKDLAAEVRAIDAGRSCKSA